jgi:predicted transposase YbfD/YdcC
LDVLALKGCIVTIDAMGCQRNIVEKIVFKEADYLLALKSNQGNLEEDAERTARFTKATSEWKEEDFGHGRIESRHCFIYQDLSFMENVTLWISLSAVVKIEAVRHIKSTGKEETETRYYITSSKASAEVIGKAVRSHWGIENQLHWQLDVSFSEDQSRKREGYAAQNFSLLNRIALNLIKHESSKKKSVRRNRLDAGWDNDYLLKILKN